MPPGYRNRRAWGYAFTAVLLAKVATLGGAVLAMALFVVLDDQSVPVPQIVQRGVTARRLASTLRRDIAPTQTL